MTNAYNPGSQFRLRSSYGNRTHPITGEVKFHAGQDFSAAAGTPIPAAQSGTVVYSGSNKGFGNVVIVQNDTGEYSLYGHMQDGGRLELGQRIWPGETLGLVGSTGESTGPHLHYSVIKADKKINHSNEGGKIGIPVDQFNTINPAKYDPSPRYLEETRDVAQVMSGIDPSTASGNLPPDRPGALGDRFGKWGNAPVGTLTLVPSDHPESFDNRFENWGSVPASNFGGADSALLRALEKYRSPVAPGYPESATAAPPPSGANNSPAYVFDPTRPPPPFSPENYASAYRSIDKWIASLAGVEPQDPTEFSPPPIFSPFYRR